MRAALTLAVIAVLALVLFFAFRPAPVDPAPPPLNPPAEPTRRQKAAAALDRIAAALKRAARAPATEQALAWAGSKIDPAPICVGPPAGNSLEVSPPAAGACPAGGTLCPGIRCSGPIPSCVDPAGTASCPVCADGAPRCKPGDYYRTDPATWQAGPSNSQTSPYNGSAANFPYCTQLGEDCSWASINSKASMLYTGRGVSDPEGTTGYRVVSSSGESFYRDVGWDNTASFDPEGLAASSAESLESCELQALGPSTNNGLPVAGGYAYYYNGATGDCDIHRLQGSMRTQGTAEFVKSQ